MKVELIHHVPNALDLLLFTKGTRLKMEPLGLAEVTAMPYEDKMKELGYMLGTIASSWKFVDYIFVITGVTRAFTHQLVRHRIGTSFAQQAQRAVDMSGFTYVTPDFSYMQLGILPTNIATNIIFKANLRTLADMAEVRLCVKTQGEFQNVFRAIKDRVVEVHPWAFKFIKVHCARWGTCKFPTFPVEDCPVKIHVYDPTQCGPYGGYKGKATMQSPSDEALWSLEEIEKFHEENRAEAQPGIKPPEGLSKFTGGFVDRNGAEVFPGDKVHYFSDDRLGILKEAFQNGDAHVGFELEDGTEMVKWAHLEKVQWKD